MTERAVQTLPDPFSPSARPDPYPAYRVLREAGPLVEIAEFGRALTRHEDCSEVLRDERFSSDFTKANDFTDEGIGAALSRLMLFMDAPDHTRLRGLVNKAFTARVVEGMRPRIQTIVDDLLDVAERDGGLDLVAGLAYPLPVIVICELLGVPAEDRDRFKGWSGTLTRLLDPMSFEAAEALSGPINEAATNLLMYFLGLIEQRRAEPKDDLLSALIAAEAQGDRLAPEELMAMCILLFIAGHETTMNLIGNGTLALLRQPDQLHRLRDDSSLTRTGIEELLRYDPAVQLTVRTALEDVEIAGATIPRGEQVIVLIGSANRDPVAFAEPDRLDVGRADNRHLAFGGGPHFCVGAPLARVEGQVAIATLLRRFPGLRLASEPEWREQVTLRGLRRLQLEF